jgi:hypothetical protein
LATYATVLLGVLSAFVGAVQRGTCASSPCWGKETVTKHERACSRQGLHARSLFTSIDSCEATNIALLIPHKQCRSSSLHSSQSRHHVNHRRDEADHDVD